MPAGIAGNCNRTDNEKARDAIGIMFRAMHPHADAGKAADLIADGRLLSVGQWDVSIGI